MENTSSRRARGVEAVRARLLPGRGPALLESVERRLVGDAGLAVTGVDMIGLPYPGAAPPRHRHGHDPPPRAPPRGRGVDVRLWPDRLRHAPHRARAGQPDLRHPAPLPELHRAARCTTWPTSPTSTTTSSSGPPSSAAPSPTWPPSSRPAGGSRWTRWVTCAHRTSRTPRSTSRTWWLWWVSWWPWARPTRRRTVSTWRSPRSTGTASWRSSRSSRCRSGHGSRPTRTSARPSTSPCGRRPSRVSPAGTHRGGRAGPGGTPSAWSCRSTCWARGSTCTVAGRT